MGRVFLLFPTRKHKSFVFCFFSPLMCLFHCAASKKKKKGEIWGNKNVRCLRRDGNPAIKHANAAGSNAQHQFLEKRGGGGRIYSSTSYVAFLFSIVSGVSCVGGLTRDLQLDECVLSLQFKECKRLERIWPIPIVFHKTFFFFFLRAKVHGHCERYTKKTAG